MVFVPIDIRRLFRDKVAIFFVFVFPLIFLFVFGTIFGGTDNVSFKVALINQSNNEFATKFVEQAKETEVLDIDESVTNMDEAREKMKRSEVSATQILPENFGAVGQNKTPAGQIVVMYDQNNEQAGQTLQAVLESMFDEINSQFVQTAEPFTVKTE